ncbi:MAG: 2-oxo acid dehydrogenase subunit E2 [Planctomycetota bacterium]
MISPVLLPKLAKLPVAPVCLPHEGAPHISPRARRKLRELNISWTALQLPAEGRRITERDVLAAVQHLTQSVEKSSASRRLSVERAPLNLAQRQIAEHAAYSQQFIPQFSLDMLALATPLLNLQKTLQAEKGRAEAPRLEDFFLRALGLTLADESFKVFRGVIDGDDVVYRSEINISFTVWLGENEMLTPVARGVDQLSLEALARMTRELRRRAGRKLSATFEYVGGIMTLISLESYHARSFRSIVRPGESATLTLPAAQPHLFPSARGKKTRTQLAWQLSLSADRRLVSEVLAAKFLSKIIALLEKPACLTD